ncbi:hypothetical protein HUU05_22425 [candidate division KSB1 bacterium]|nr:hypothetical protein [candidate division KSB1 bacterium]
MLKIQILTHSTAEVGLGVSQFVSQQLSQLAAHGLRDDNERFEMRLSTQKPRSLIRAQAFSDQAVACSQGEERALAFQAKLHQIASRNLREPARPLDFLASQTRASKDVALAYKTGLILPG